MQNPYNHDLDRLFEAKHRCGLEHNVIFISKDTIKPYIDFMIKNYGSLWKEQFKV